MRVSLVVVGVLGLITAGAGTWAWTVSAGHIEVADESADGADAARAPVAIVLGAAVHADGLPSPWLSHRLDIAADLYTSGRTEAILVSGDNRRAGYDEPTVMRRYLLSQGIPDQAVAVDYAGFDTYDTCVRARRVFGIERALLVSGDNGQENYNEPVAMRRYLVAAGIPDEAIALDYAGFDTYDTCVRARRIFGIERALLVTQDVHEPRAVAICRSVGLSVDGVGDSRARHDRISWAVSWTRERPATIKAVIDVVSRRDPTLGHRETSVAEAINWTREHRR